ncbi:MAG: TetR/AcrR family transcriptional regulator [Ruminiclostridium sp.]
MEASILHRKDSLILTAIEVLNELGIQGLSTREIARRQGVSEATLFRHYKTKSDLLVAMIDYDSKFDSDIITSVRMKKLNPRAAIIYFINSFAEYYENYPAITAISQAYDVLSCEPLLADKIKHSFFTRLGFLKELTLEAQLVGEINKVDDSEKLAYLIWGSFMSICLNWRFNKYSFSLKEYTLSTLDIALDAFEIKRE